MWSWNYWQRNFWAKGKDLEVESDKYNLKKQKYRHELMPNTKFQQYRAFLQNGFVQKKLKAVENHF